ncbi:hypothetical protein [Neobacillus drentensis]|uniref:hypothetical protein n=1 Tax=Neobacillus drentensis TaxID=220684 RepID=UPI0030004A64
MVTVCKLCGQIREVNRIGVCQICMDVTDPIVRPVTYIDFPDTEDGRLGFKYRKFERYCVPPSSSYSGPNCEKIGRCHIYDIEEWTDLFKSYRTENHNIMIHEEYETWHGGKY